MDFCIFSGWSFSIALIQSDTIFTDIRVNAAVHSNNQVRQHCILFMFLSKAVVVLSNCEVRDCGGAGVKAEEGSTLNLLNCQVKKHSVLDDLERSPFAHLGEHPGAGLWHGVCFR